MRRISWTTLATLAILVAQHSWALSCAQGTRSLTENYQDADAIVIATATECTPTPNPENHPWGGGNTCELVPTEVLKPASSSRDYQTVGQTTPCGLRLENQQQFLLFLDASNAIQYSSAPLQRYKYPNELAIAEIEVLRDFRDGRLDAIGRPWVFQKGPIGNCMLTQASHQIALSIGQRPKSEGSLLDANFDVLGPNGQPLLPPHIAESAKRVWSKPEFLKDQFKLWINISLGEPRLVVRSAFISVGDQDWELGRHVDGPIDEFPGLHPEQLPASYRLMGDVAEAALEGMKPGTPVTVSATRLESNATPKPMITAAPPESTTNTDSNGTAIIRGTPQGSASNSRPVPQSVRRRAQEAPAVIEVTFDTTAIEAPLQRFLECAAAE